MHANFSTRLINKLKTASYIHSRNILYNFRSLYSLFKSKSGIKSKQKAHQYFIQIIIDKSEIAIIESKFCIFSYLLLLLSQNSYILCMKYMCKCNNYHGTKVVILMFHRITTSVPKIVAIFAYTFPTQNVTTIMGH